MDQEEYRILNGLNWLIIILVILIVGIGALHFKYQLTSGSGTTVTQLQEGTHPCPLTNGSTIQTVDEQECLAQQFLEQRILRK